MQRTEVMPGRRRRLAAAVAAGCLIAGCRHYPGPALPPAALREGGPRAAVRVERRDGSRVDLARVTVRGDTLFGVGRLAGRGAAHGPWALHVGEIAGVREGQVSAGRTAAAALGAAAVVLGAFVAVVSNSTLQ